MKVFPLFLMVFLCFFRAQSQNACTHPPVVFPNGKILCDTRPLKTVFYDGFDGNSLKSPWITFKSWDGMPGGDHPNWSEGYVDRNVIIKDNNVVVSNGTVKLKVKREASSWKCDTCTKTAYALYSGSSLSLPYNNKFINSGYLEARIKMPDFFKAHTTMWLWYGAGPAGDEIDIAEGYGNSGNGGFFGGFPYVNYSTHAWWSRRKPSDNPCNLPIDEELRNRFPGSTWWNWNFDRTFKSYEFNTYACDWDTSRVVFYLNGSEVGTIWKYYGYKYVWVNSYDLNNWQCNPCKKLTRVMAGSTCTGDGSTVWNVTPGFPYNKNSECQLRFTANLDNTADMTPMWPKLPDAFLGEMEIDYVKIAQRAVDPGFTPCNAPNSVIYGTEHLCGNGTATMTAATPSSNGTWISSPEIMIVSQNSSSAVVKSAIGTSAGVGYISYYPNGSNCYADSYGASQSSGHQIYLWKPAQINVAVVKNLSVPNFTQTYLLTAYSSNTNPSPHLNYMFNETYEWNIDYGPNQSLHYHTYGKTVSTPLISWIPTDTVGIKWKLTVSNRCGSTNRQGLGRYAPFGKPWPPVDPINERQDGVTSYFRAEVTDQIKYSEAVDRRVDQIMFSPELNDTDIVATIEEIRMDELYPYIIDSNVYPSALFKTGSEIFQDKENDLQQLVNEQVKVSPNPAKDLLYVTLNKAHKRDEFIEISVIDLYGRQVINSKQLWTEQIPVSISGLSAGTYFLKLRDSQLQKTIRFVKE